ncbi:MAG TPA: ABC transporter ATP-binding protein [Candidatus Paceibacterota bacterium]
MSTTITLKNVSKAFAELIILHDVNLEIKMGEFFVFVGPSGAGKSTILRIMSGLESDFKGSLTLSEGLTRRDMSFVFQQFALLPWLSVEENVGLGLVARGVPPKERHERVMKELSQLGLEKFAHVKPRELSGGMRQRVGIARAFVTDPKVIFMDEPFSELDSFTAEVLRKELLGIWEKRKPTIIMVTHIVEEAVELADRIAVLTPRPARIEHVVENNLPRPRKERSEEFYNLEDRVTQLVRP